jgi:biopolymer transport protein ExbB/TolQ
MAIIYKGYALSKSLYGDKIFHIARNSARFVVFREKTQEGVKKAIDNYLKNQEKEKELAEKAKTKAAKEAKAANKRGLIQSNDEVKTKTEAETKKKIKSTASTKQQSKVLIESAGTNNPLLENELKKQVEEAKKSSSSSKKNNFWDRLK